MACRKDVSLKVFFPPYDITSQVAATKELNESETGRNETVAERPEGVTPIQPNPTQSNKEYMSIFDESRKLFKGTKRGNQTEFDNFVKKHTDWKEVLPLLLPAVQYQIKQRAKDGFYWKNFQTWINNRC